MTPAGVRIALLPLLLLPLVGCAELQRVNVTELHPGSYCEIEMVVPPNAADDSHHCYMGTVQEITHDEVVLTEVLETTNIDYSGSGHRRAPTERKHKVVRVPLTGVVEIWSELPKGKVQPSGSAAPPATAKLPSEGAHPVMLPNDGAAANGESGFEICGEVSRTTIVWRSLLPTSGLSLPCSRNWKLYNRRWPQS